MFLRGEVGHIPDAGASLRLHFRLAIYITFAF